MTRTQTVEQGTSIRRRKKRLDIEPGKSISTEDIEKVVISSTSKTTVCTNKKKVSRKANALDSSSEEDGHSLGSESSFNLSEIDFEDKSTLEVLNDGFIPAREEFVMVDYEGEYWPGQVQTLATNGAYIKCMARSGNLWKWPDKEDCVFYPKKDIKLSISKPTQRSTKRKLFYVPELEGIWGKPKK